MLWLITAILTGIFFWQIIGYVIGMAFLLYLAYWIRELIMYLGGYDDISYVFTFFFLMCFLWICVKCRENM